MYTRRDLLKYSAAAAASTLVLGLPTAAKAAGTPASAPPLSITITASEYAFTVPSQIPAGLVHITMKNVGRKIHMAQIGRLNDGVTFDQFKTVLETKPQGSALPLFKFRGGPNNVPPGGAQEVINTLDPGHYVLVCFVIDPDGVPHYMKGMLQQFEVVGPATEAPEPASDLTVTMADFSYMMRSQITAGHHVWKIVNHGPAPHEIELLKLAPGISQAQAVAAYQARTTPKPAAASPFAPAGGIGTLAPGTTGWLITDLPSGNYLTLCRVPDPKTHKLHYLLGMVMEFRVT